MNQTIIFACLVAAALVHASFQLSVSMLTLLSGHALGRQASHRNLLHLSTSFTLGAGLATMLLLATSCYIALVLQPYLRMDAIWAAASGLTLGTGLAIWFTYYRHSTGTSLWLPREMAKYLNSRTKATRMSGEAFGLGVSSVLAEIIFILAPLVVAGLLIASLSIPLAAAAILTYCAVSMLPLLVITMLINGGHPISQLQKWREKNKRFMQFSAGSILIVLGFFLYVNYVVSNSAALAKALTA